MKLDAHGHRWVGRYHFPGTVTNVWDVFDGRGVWLGTVDAPSGLEVHEISVDGIIGVAKDEYDVPYVQVHELRRESGGAS